MSIIQKAGFIFGPIFFFLFYFYHPFENLSAQGHFALGTAIFMALWWLTEPVPISVTALLPLLLFPLLGNINVKIASGPYAHPLIFMFLGGFIIAEAMKRWNLHKRIALNIVALIGDSPSKIILGFMIASAFLSMWMSNTAVTMMMMPIGVSVILIFSDTSVHEEGKVPYYFSICLMLGIAYASSIGGLSTIIGSTPNAVLAGFYSENYGKEIDFFSWFKLAFPVTLVLLPITWVLLTKLIFPLKLDHDIMHGLKKIHEEKSKLGKMSKEEQMVSVVFVTVAMLWMLQLPLKKVLSLPGLNNTTIAIFGAMLIFLFPVNLKEKKFLLDKTWYKKIEWDILILIGGGLSLAKQITTSGMAEWIGNSLSVIQDFPTLAIVLVVTTLIIFLTELTSNTATAATFIPIIASLAQGIGQDPLTLTFPITLGATCAFMLPVATPPNAIVYSTGYVKTNQMMKAGILVNLISILLLTTLAYLIAQNVLKIN